MDEKKNNIRLVKTGGRRVTNTADEYNGSGGFDKNYGKKRSKNSSALERRVRYQKRQKELRIKKQRRRAAVIIIIAAAGVAVLMFLTPIFNIRSVTVEGNVIVTAEQFQDKLKPLIGENLFRTGSGKIRKTLKTIPYINTAEVQKKIFPPSVKVTVTEYTPAAIVKTGGKSLIINLDLLVLSDSGSGEESLPAITGFTVNDYKLGEAVKSDSEEKDRIASSMLRTLESAGIINNTVEINLSNTADIIVNYDNRITVLCGSQFEIERKLRLFRETVTNNSIDENARGTMDLKEAGKAVYTPEIYTDSKLPSYSEDSVKSNKDTDKKSDEKSDEKTDEESDETSDEESE